MIRILLAAIAGIIIAQGTGRFLLTPVLPAMQAAGGLDDAAAGAIGAANFAGYLAGAVAATVIALSARQMIVFGSLLVIIGTVATAWHQDLWLMGRAVAGFGGALVFVAVGSAAPTMLEAIGRRDRVLHIYTGVGIAIAGTGALALAVGPDADRVWFASAILAVLLVPLAAVLQAPAPRRAGGHGPVLTPAMVRVVGAYGCLSFGFGAGGTFFVRVFAGGDPTAATLAWIAAGFVMAPSVLVWAGLAQRFGGMRMLVPVQALHALGLGIAVVSTAPIPAAIAGFLLGGTFMGATALCLARVRALAPDRGQTAIAVATVVFGVGQVLGPLAAGPLMDATGSPAAAFGLAAAVTLIGALLVLPDRNT